MTEKMKPRGDNVRQPARRKDRRPAPATGTGGSGEQQPAPADNTSAADRKKQFDTHHGSSKLTSLHKKVGASGKLPNDW
jgi:hypothetical protein